MNSRSPQPCRRVRLLSALKLSEKPKDLGITRKNFARAKAYEMAHPIPYVAPTIHVLQTRRHLIDTLVKDRKVPVRDPPQFPVNRNFSQTVIYTFDDVKDEPELSECSGDDDVYLASAPRIQNEDQSTPEAIDFPQLAMPDFPSPLLKSECDVISWSPSTPVRAHKGNKHTPYSRVSSTLETPMLTVSSSSATSNVVTTPGSFPTTPASSYMIQYSSGQCFSSTPITPRSSSNKPTIPLAKPIIKLHTINEQLLSPSDLPSPSLVKLDHRKPGPEILAGLDFLTKFYARTNLND
ncbi:uncharacterized protein MELLADRAFT_90189 [Melampsora larici-populina 98AG31]|uniref:Uncharacterized protein n=1 Tax=Melampsora larici-populina (strain 98AG31 / pathotype 3-4-7) TaxID=747676 RepID=F4RW15_MELLP|nr:uncharacterized protein MELLADRAFT_90189 [Melampsora larici-populina 98AG31]EGG03457.1 hypothetical protein MELLADRAFT_90189 [Melampsora larici-populina 98AG31]